MIRSAEGIITAWLNAQFKNKVELLRKNINGMSDKIEIKYDIRRAFFVEPFERNFSMEPKMKHANALPTIPKFSNITYTMLVAPTGLS